METTNSPNHRSVELGLVQALLFLAVFLSTGSVFGLPNIRVLALVLLSWCWFFRRSPTTTLPRERLLTVGDDARIRAVILDVEMKMKHVESRARATAGEEALLIASK